MKWVYVPITHDAEHYYCLIDDKPRAGTHILEKMFVCGGDRAEVETDYNINWKPRIPLYGGHQGRAGYGVCWDLYVLITTLGTSASCRPLIHAAQ